MIDKMELLEEICDWYGYDIHKDEKLGIICYQNEECSVAAATIDELLVEWLPTLEESNKECDNSDEKHLWHNEEIEFIKSLVKN